MLRETIPGRLGFATTWRLAWRNLGRNHRRTWITVATAAIAVLLLQLVAALLLGLERQSFDNLINYQTGHAKIFAEGYFAEREDLPLDFTLSRPQELRARVESVSGVAAATPRLTFQAQLSNGVDQIPAVGLGIQVVGSDTDVFVLPQAVTDGSYLVGEEEGLLLGGGLAEIMGVGVGDWLTVLTKTRAGAYEALDFPVTGLLGTGNPLIDRSSFVVPLHTAQSMVGLGDAVTELAVRFVPRAREGATLRRLKREIETTGGLDVKGWREVEDSFLALVQLKRNGSIVALGIFVLLASVGIANTILMSAYERTREIGMLMAMGTRNGGIRTLFLAEGALTGLLGGAAGTLVAIAVILLLSGGMDLNAIYGDMDIGYPVKDRIYLALSPIGLGAGWLAAAALAALASLYPAARAAQSEPVEALRHV